MEVLIGMDPHKATNAVATIDEQGELVGQENFPPTGKGCGPWSGGRSAFRIGRPLAQKLLASGERVVDVPPKLSARVRVLSSFAGNARKNDRPDATFTALAALRNDRLASVHPEDGPEGHAEILRLLTERREDLVAERTRALNRLHVLLRDLLSDTVRRQLSADAAAKLSRRARLRHPAGQIRRGLASDLVRDVRALDRRIAELDERIGTEVEAVATLKINLVGEFRVWRGEDLIGSRDRDRQKTRSLLKLAEYCTLRPAYLRHAASGGRSVHNLLLVADPDGRGRSRRITRAEW